MPRPTRFLAVEEILTLHEAALHQYGGLDGVRDLGALESAVAMPRQGFSGEYAHSFPFEMAAAYAFHIAENQPFLDGNKRTALAATIAFLRLNGWSLIADEMDAAQQILDFAAKKQDKPGFAKWLGTNSKERPTMELREFMRSLTFRSLVDTAQTFHIARGASPSEFAATFEEAADAIPILREFMFHCQRSWESTSDVEKAVAIDFLKTIMALYRIAEDMGYEW